MCLIIYIIIFIWIINTLLSVSKEHPCQMKTDLNILFHISDTEAKQYYTLGISPQIFAFTIFKSVNTNLQHILRIQMRESHLNHRSLLMSLPFYLEKHWFRIFKLKRIFFRYSTLICVSTESVDIHLKTYLSSYRFSWKIKLLYIS